jgi:hypothetical protein
MSAFSQNIQQVETAKKAYGIKKDAVVHKMTQLESLIHSKEASIAKFKGYAQSYLQIPGSVCLHSVQSIHNRGEFYQLIQGVIAAEQQELQRLLGLRETLLQEFQTHSSRLDALSRLLEQAVLLRQKDCDRREEAELMDRLSWNQ